MPSASTTSGDVAAGRPPMAASRSSPTFTISATPAALWSPFGAPATEQALAKAHPASGGRACDALRESPLDVRLDHAPDRSQHEVPHCRREEELERVEHRRTAGVLP